jgi:hypothetical protein
MGEATYYLKAQFESQAAAEAAVPGIKRLISEGIQAQDWWQNHRRMEHEGKRAEFWSGFKEKFPLTTKYLQSFQAGCCGGEHILLDDDCNNGPAGFLDFGSDEEDLEAVNVQGNTVTYYALVWHFARWDPFLNFIASEHGAVKIGWVSDEYLEPFDSILMEPVNAKANVSA